MEEHNKIDLAALGQLLLRLSPAGGGRLMNCQNFDVQIGGAELNVAVGAAALGLRTGIISKIPCHDIGQLMKNGIAAYGVDHSYLIFDTSAEARIGIYYYEYGAYPRKPRVIYDRADSSFLSLNLGDIPEEIYRSVRCFHTSGITLGLGEAMRNLTAKILQRFKKGGALISFDVNYRANLWSGSEARAEIERILPYVDIFFCSEDTARLTFGKTGTLREILRSFSKEYSLSVVASTRRIVHSPKIHTFGSVIYDAVHDELYEEEPYKNIDVIDRIGSGDAYISGVLYGLLTASMNCRRALEYGNAAGALKNTIPGDLLLSGKKEIDGIIAAHKITGWQSELER